MQRNYKAFLLRAVEFHFNAKGTYLYDCWKFLIIKSDGSYLCVVSMKYIGEYYSGRQAGWPDYYFAKIFKLEVVTN